MKVNAANLKMMMDAIYGLKSDITLRCVNGKMETITIDPARVMLVNMSIPYEGDESDIVFMFEIGKVKKMLPSKGEIEINVTDSKIEFICDGKKVRTRRMSTEYPEIKIPELEYTGSGIMTGEEFVEMIKDASEVSDGILFTIDNGSGVASAAGTLDEVEYDFAARGNGKGKYSTGYLGQISSTVGKFLKNKVVEISLGENIPIKIEVKDEDVYCMWIVAPRIDDEVV